MYPLRFKPVFRRYIWGGRRLATELNKPIGDDSCAESWEIADHNDSQSVVQYGSLAGKSLHDLVIEHGESLLGPAIYEQIHSETMPQNLRGRFPLLLKFLDANRNLSVQVHPDDELGARLTPPDLGKTEAWYVIHAEPNSKIYAGLKSGVTADQLKSAAEQGMTEQLLHSFQPSPGDCVFIKAGTLHAIGAGLLIAEIQQASNTTFRLFDWNRRDDQGNQRPLHVDECLCATNFELGPVQPNIPEATEFTAARTIASCEKFVMRRWLTDQPISFDDEKMHIIAVTKGEIQISGDPAEENLKLGNSAIIPASLAAEITPCGEAELLDIFLPQPN